MIYGIKSSFRELLCNLLMKSLKKPFEIIFFKHLAKTDFFVIEYYMGEL